MFKYIKLQSKFSLNTYNPFKFMDKYSELYDLVTSLKDDFDKFYDKKNKAAGTRVRKGMQEVAAWAKEVRAEVQAMKNAGME